MNCVAVRELVRFSYGGKSFDFDPDTLRFGVPGRPNRRLEERWARVQDSDKPPSPAINFITVNVAQDCNLACPYCYAHQGDFGGPRMMMPEDVAVKAVDWMFANSGDKQDCYIRFLGGEPVLNVPVMRKTMEHAERRAEESGKRIHFCVNTNGTIFTSALEEAILKHRMSVLISIDGTREVHDRSRIFVGGKGSYDAIARNVEKFLACDPYAMANATITASNPDVYDYALNFRGLGFRLVRFALVGTVDPQIAVRSDELLERVLDNYDRLAKRYMSDLRSGDVWYMYDALRFYDGLVGLKKKTHRCGAGVGSATVCADGSIHLCHRFASSGSQKIGQVDGGPPKVPESVLRMSQLLPSMPLVPADMGEPVPTGPVFRHHRLDGEMLFEQRGSRAGGFNVCSACDIRHLCGGGCFSDSAYLFGDIHGGSDSFKCEADRHLAKIAMWLIDEIYREGGSLLEEVERLHGFAALH